MNENKLYRKTINILGSVPIINDKNFNTFTDAKMPVSKFMKSMQNPKLKHMSINNHRKFIENLLI